MEGNLRIYFFRINILYKVNDLKISFMIFRQLKVGRPNNYTAATAAG